MFGTKSVPVLFSIIIYVSQCQRRIKDGQELSVDRKYVVYLVKAPISSLGYDTWLCGGAIVSSEFVVTSAACVNDVDFLYVIAGYKKYVSDNEIETDPCTANKKKKVIYTCSPKGYDLKYGELDYWSFIDIALVKVESPFDFDDPTYETLCSYKPTTIPINYEEKYQEPGTDALVLGWGHTDRWRKPGDTRNYNQPVLKYAPTLLLDKNACVEHYEDYANMSTVIKTYMICSLGKGNIDDEGNTIQQSRPLQNGCTSQQQKLLGFEGVSCEKGSSESSSEEDDTRRYEKRSNQTNNLTLKGFNKTRARRSGICQNDHGGPIITWAGSKEVLIGVASVFKVSEDYECMGPYLYTSTRCTGLFLDCILNSVLPDRAGRRYLCDRPPSEKGFDNIERTISWKGHPAGLAENENIGRSGPKPKLSPGLKYLTNNNFNVENENYDPNKKFQAYKNPPSNVVRGSHLVAARSSINEPRERILGIQSFPINYRQQEATHYESNNEYVGNKNPAIAGNAHNERFKIKERIPETRSLSEMKNLRVNERGPESGYSVNTRSSGQQPFSANERNLGNEMNPGILRHPGVQSPVASLRLPVTRRYPVSVKPPINHQRIPANMAVRSVRPLRN